MRVEFTKGPSFEDLTYSFRTEYPATFEENGQKKRFVVWQISYIDKTDVGFNATFENGQVFFGIVNANPHSSGFGTGVYEYTAGESGRK